MWPRKGGVLAPCTDSPTPTGPHPGLNPPLSGHKAHIPSWEGLHYFFGETYSEPLDGPKIWEQRSRAKTSCPHTTVHLLMCRRREQGFSSVTLSGAGHVRLQVYVLWIIKATHVDRNVRNRELEKGSRL